MKQRIVYIDARCLQDERYRQGPVGQYAAILLGAARTSLAEHFELDLVGLIDRELPDLNAADRTLFDRVRTTAYVEPAIGGGWFLQLSPMTHSPLRIARLLERRDLFCTTVVHDFDAAETMSAPEGHSAGRIAYHTSLVWLRSYELFLPISLRAAESLRAFVGSEARILVSSPGRRLEEGPTGLGRIGEAGRVWAMIAAEEPRSNPAATPRIAKGVKPRIAVVTPLPPDLSGVADYSAAFLERFADDAEIHVFTDTAIPRPSPRYAGLEPISALPYVARNFDRVISVLGNSPLHARICDLLLRHGGACIAHDSRMIDFYIGILGMERACRQASRELSRETAAAELRSWALHIEHSPVLLLGEIAEASTPLILHSKAACDQVRSRYGVEARYVPYAVYRPWQAEAFAPERRAAARTRLNLPDGTILVASFGFPQSAKALDECLWALEVLRHWGVPARLAFVGQAVPAVEQEILRLADKLELTGHVEVFPEPLSEERYRSYLLAADVGLQLRTFGLGQLSGALQDCIAAALPTVANESLADALEAPGFVRRVHDNLSPVEIAETIARIVAEGEHRQRPLAESASYETTHNFDTYSMLVMRALELDG